MYEELLEQCGLTKNESLAYLALLKLGKAKSGEIIREADISGGKIYETLYKLVDKGLIKQVTENKVKRFIPNDPKSILSYVKEKQKNLEEKEKFLTTAYKENYILFFEHDAVNECCRLIETEKGIRAGVSFSLKDII